MITEKQNPRGGTRWGLTARLIALVLSVVTVTVGIICAYFVFRQNAQLQDAMRERDRSVREELHTKGTEIATSVARSAERAIALMDFLFVAEIVETTVRADQAILYGMVVNDSELAVVHSDKDRAGQIVPRAGRAGADRRAPTAEQVTWDGQEILEVVAPITVDEAHWGEVRFGLSLRGLEQQLAEARRATRERVREIVVSSGLAAILLALLGSAVGALLASRIASPMRELAAGVEQIRKGRLDHKVAVRGSREVVALASAYNEMTDRLSGLLDEMAEKASLDRELEVARRIQANMMPSREIFEVGAFSLAGRCDMATNCGGDWWSFHALPDQRLLLVVGDATGHGLPAAMLVATARGALEAIVGAGNLTSPRAVLEALHRAIVDVGRSEYQMTACAMIFDPAHGRLELANAGHVQPLACAPGSSGDRGRLHPLALRGNPLGSDRPRIGQQTYPMTPGEAFVVWTDGVNERRNAAGQEYGFRRVQRLLASAELAEGGDQVRSLRDDLVDSVEMFAGGTAADDDITVVVLSYRAP